MEELIEEFNKIRHLGVQILTEIHDVVEPAMVY